MTTVRTFLAIPLPDTLMSYLAWFTDSIRNKLDLINWIKADNLHITLSFLGDTKIENIEEHGNALSHCIEKCEPVKLGTTDTGIFPHANDPRVLWVGTAPYDASFISLAMSIRNGLMELGYHLDNRKFQPHITLGRVKSISRKSTFIHDFLSTEVRDTQFVADEVKWFKSTLTPSGAIYEELETFKLNTGGRI
ncbi:MAG: RNA 2',3'-cyclic phosphodiesterase [Candidatus Marinimicrobia bacterium]|nr:RNA 2',3'-cyclic phosphodiesterase [Candidatus Neomarinimicrobiota bacterium]